MITNEPAIRTKNKLAIVCLIIGLLSVLLCLVFFSWFFGSYVGNNELVDIISLFSFPGGIIIGIVAVIIGIISLIQIKKKDMFGIGAVRGGIILGCLGIILNPLIFIIFLYFF